MYDLKNLDDEKDFEKTYYKSRWIKEKVDVTIDGVKKKAESVTCNIKILEGPTR